MYEKFEITGHNVEGSVTQVKVTVEDYPGQAGANHLYRISGIDTSTNPSMPSFSPPQEHLDIMFQNGPVSEFSMNGIPMEALLAICAHRLRCFQRGPFPCEENEQALEYTQKALEALKSRTQKRLGQRVEGKNIPHD